MEMDLLLSWELKFWQVALLGTRPQGSRVDGLTSTKQVPFFCALFSFFSLLIFSCYFFKNPYYGVLSTNFAYF